MIIIPHDYVSKSINTNIKDNFCQILEVASDAKHLSRYDNLTTKSYKDGEYSPGSKPWTEALDRSPGSKPWKPLQM